MGLAVVRPYAVPSQTTQTLPFRVRLVQNSSDLAGAVRMRSDAYRRRLPVIADLLAAPEPEDTRDDVLILIAENKFDNAIIGTLRLVPNFFHPLKIEGEIELPAWLKGKRLVEFMRLGVENGTVGRLVFAALAKAAYEICFTHHIDFILVTGRYPVELIYRSLQFEDLLGHPIDLTYTGGLPHRVFYFDVQQADQKWRESGNLRYPFMAHTTHPDIEVDANKVEKEWGRALQMMPAMLNNWAD